MSYYADDLLTLHHGDCVEVMRELPAESVDAVVTDPPYGLEFMGKEWDRLGEIGKASHAGWQDGQPEKYDYPHQRGTSKHASYNASSNLKCLNCGRWKWAPAKTKCSCDKPTWPNVKAKQSRDMQAWHEAWGREAFRVAKPGAHLLAFGGTRTYHRLASAIEDAGWEIRDCLVWAYASGFPKSLDVGKAIDKRGGADIGWFGPWLRQERERRGITQKSLAVHFPSKTNGLTGCVANWELGFNLPTVDQFNKLCEVLELPFTRIEEAEREVIGTDRSGPAAIAFGRPTSTEFDVTAPATPDAARWDGWGTALKPAWEPIVMARKPLRGTVAANVLAHGTGALNIGATRIGTGGGTKAVNFGDNRGDKYGGGAGKPTNDIEAIAAGRWPANLMLSDAIFDGGVPGVVGGGTAKPGGGITEGEHADIGYHGNGTWRDEWAGYGDAGTYSRFFLIPKSSRSDREPLLRGTLPDVERPNGNKWSDQDYRTEWSDGVVRKGGNRIRANTHPTCKPTDLMRHLVRLVTPPGGTVLDPFLGSGTTAIAANAEGFRAIGIEREQEYLDIAVARLAHQEIGLGLDVAAPVRKAPKTHPDLSKHQPKRRAPAENYTGGWAGTEADEVPA